MRSRSRVSEEPQVENELGHRYTTPRICFIYFNIVVPVVIP